MQNLQCTGARALLSIALVTALLVPGRSAAQEALPAAAAADFIGLWTVGLQTDMGPVQLRLDIRDDEGRVVAEVESPQGREVISDVSRAEDDLVLRYAMNADGQVLPISITLRRDGEGLNARIDVGGGMFIAMGNGVRVE